MVVAEKLPEEAVAQPGQNPPAEVLSFPKPVPFQPNTLEPDEKPVLAVFEFTTDNIPVALQNGQIPKKDVPYIYAEVDFEPSAEINGITLLGDKDVQVYAVTIHGEVLRIPPAEELPDMPPSRTTAIGGTSPISPTLSYGMTLKLSKIYVVLPPRPEARCVMVISGREKNLGTMSGGELEFETYTPPGKAGEEARE